MSSRWDGFGSGGWGGQPSGNRSQPAARATVPVYQEPNVGLDENGFFDQVIHLPVAHEKKYGTQEDWIPEFVGQYAMNDIGELIRTPHVTARNASVNKLDVKIHDKIGAPAYDLKKSPYYVAVLVLRTFRRYEKRYEIPFHKDNDLWNFSIDNLEWRDYRQTNDKHRRGYAVMWKLHEDEVNYVQHPHAGKQFKNGVVYTPPPPKEVVTLKERPKIPFNRGVSSTAARKGHSIKTKQLPPPPKVAEASEDVKEVTGEIFLAGEPDDGNYGADPR